MTTDAEKTRDAIGKIPVPIEKVEGGYRLGPGYRALMTAYDLAQKAVDAENSV